MLTTYQNPEYDYIQSQEQQTGQAQQHVIAIIGAGPVGLTAALDCAKRGIACVVFDDNNTVSVGSRALCYAKRALEIWQRLGVAQPILDKGVNWQVGKNFFGETLAYQFDLLPEDGHQMPAMVNLQQYYLEEYLVNACQAEPLVDLRWKHRVEDLQQHDKGVTLTVTTPDGTFTTHADWVIACDGAGSSMRDKVGAQFTGQVFDDQFLIADVVMKNDFPKERWFWFDPPFHRNQSVLLHREADDVWRIDFQLGNDADADYWKRPENVTPLLKQMLGDEVEFELEWVSVYRFACRRMENFCHGRVIFAGDAAHQVSPFGARGANSGVQDTDNLIWKLQLVIQGLAPPSLLDSYALERQFAADENIGHSTRATDFITPKSRASRIMRDAVLSLAREQAFARPLVNSGRLSTATSYVDSPLSTPDTAGFNAPNAAPGAFAPDAEITCNGQQDWLLKHLGAGFVALVFADNAAAAPLNVDGISVTPLVVGREIIDSHNYLRQRYDGQPGTVYLIRPDQHIAGRWRHFDAQAISDAVRRATGNHSLNQERSA
ncbi:MAG: FAD-dependent oxidoreductase [Gammaproteobacteria bacterium]|nr:MAG: FAD-dependent oxidoreductase [Gammaproteobacteria bacterium]